MVRRVPNRNKHNQGLTLLESLVAIVVIAVSMAATAPLIVLAVGTRVQNQRSDQAMQLAQAEIDRLRLIVERGDRDSIGAVNALVPAAPNTVVSVPDFEVGVPAPESVSTVLYTSDYNYANPVDVDNDGVTDFAVQLFRNTTSTTTTGVALDFGVRVYRATAIENYTAAQLATDSANLGLTAGEGNSGRAPLAVVYTTAFKSNAESSLCDYYDYINSTTGTSTTAPAGTC